MGKRYDFLFLKKNVCFLRVCGMWAYIYIYIDMYLYVYVYMYAIDMYTIDCV